MNFTVTSRGRQFDRLALMYLGDVEGRDPTTIYVLYGNLYSFNSLPDVDR